MIIVRRALGAVLAIGAPALAAGQTPNPRVLAETLIAIGSMVGGEGPIWTPSGSHILFASSRGGSGIRMIPRGGGEVIRLPGEVPTQLVRVSPAGDQIAFLSDKDGNPEIWLAAVNSGAQRRLTDLGARINALAWSPDGQWIAFSALRYGGFDLWKVRVADGAVTRVTTDLRYETYPTWMPDGRALLYVRSDDRWADHDVMWISATGGEPRLVTADRDMFDYGTIGTRAKFGHPVVSPDGKWVLFRSHRSGWINYWVVDIGGGSPRQLAPESADQSDARWSPDGRSIAYVSNQNGTFQIRVVPATGGPARTPVPVTLGVAGSPEWSPDGTTIAYTLATPTRPQDLYVISAAGGSPQRLTVSIDAAVERDLVTPEKVSYRSDGHTITGYLYKPPRIESGTRVPAVLLIHGGPTSQWSDTYQPQAQFLARMGYAVLAPNIRGSSGYGKAFEDANNPCWTHCDLRDVVEGTRFVSGLPWVDGAKLGITGNSYGGIMTMGATAHAPGVFQAAVAQSGYANWVSFQDYNTELQHTKLLAYEWGPYPDSAAVYRRNSSVFSADKVTTPILVLHGEGLHESWRPGVYPIPASLEFVHALDRLNKVVKYKVYPGEGYYVSGRENSKELLVDMLEFFDQYLGARHSPVGTRLGGGGACPLPNAECRGLAKTER